MKSPRLSRLANDIHGSAILQIAADVRALKAQGEPIIDLTVGDFSSKQFRIPKELEDGIVDALRAGESTYPPSNRDRGTTQCGARLLRAPPRSATIRSSRFSSRRARGRRSTRPIARSSIRAIASCSACRRGTTITTAISLARRPSSSSATRRPVFFRPPTCCVRVIRDARLLALNSPLNPTGTVFDADQLAAICDLVLEENARRGPNERPLYVMYDQVYWMITAGGVDARRSGLAAPGDGAVRRSSSTRSRRRSRRPDSAWVGRSAPPTSSSRWPTSSTHVGAWAPRAEQVATARLLADHASVDRYVDNMRREAGARLDAVHDGLTAMQRDGFPVECIRPQGAIYVSGRFALHGMRTPNGDLLETDDDVRRYILRAANLAAVPFGAFGVQRDRGGWFRLSIGVVSVAQIEAVFPPLRHALEMLVGNEVVARG